MQLYFDSISSAMDITIPWHFKKLQVHTHYVKSREGGLWMSPLKVQRSVDYFVAKLDGNCVVMQEQHYNYDKVIKYTLILSD